MKKNKVIGYGYEIIRPILKLFTLIFLNPRIINKKNIPKNGGYILAGNHLSNYDPIIVGNMTIRPIHFLAKKELMDKKILGSILRFMGIIRVDRSSKNPEAKAEAISALENGKIICLFPEGTSKKTDDVELLPFKYGAVSFAFKTGMPIVPFAIISRPKLFKYGIKVIIGKPFYVKSDDLEKENKKFYDIILKLIREGKNNESKKKNKRGA